MSDGPDLATTSATVGPYLAAKLRALEVRLEQVAARVASAEEHHEAVHDLRVALRRTRTLLEIGRGVFGRFHADEVRRALRDVQRATGALRDEEVLLDLVSSLAHGHADASAWVENRRGRERRLQRALIRLLRGGDLDHGRHMVEALLAFRVKPSRDKRLAKFARRAVDDARREVERRRSARPQDIDALHRLRIAYKRLRYTVDTFADVLPSDVVALASSAARFQSRLGDLRDADIARECVRRARALSEGAREHLLAGLARVREERMLAYTRELGVAIIGPITSHAVGAESLRNTSTR